ncbi:MAG: MotA/TolQ/ExbB proton channel family protein [Planctomycetota bacterium]|nr:MotA/TolQ/ExbB proton channel family protein [Planctomycetota bacterium]
MSPHLRELSADLLNRLSGYSAPFIVGVAIVHILAYLWLIRWSRRDLRRMADDFDAFTREVKHRSVLDRSQGLASQINAFLADVGEVLDDPSRKQERQALAQRMRILDEERRYLQSESFESAYTVCRTMIEAYPLAGVLGTILAIGAALQGGHGDSQKTVSDIVRNFGDSVWATFAGLSAGILMMFLNSLVETRFRRLLEIRAQIRDTIARAKRELSLSGDSES